MVFFSLYGWRVYEEFLNITEGFQVTTDINLSSCPPSEADESVPMKARVPAGSTQTYCYENDIQKCSLSVPRDSPNSCSQYYLALLYTKASARCPTSMPNYYQNIQYANNVDKSTRGCTSGTRTADGKSPAGSDSRCIIYSNQKDDLEKLDSCTNIKRLESAQCFSTPINGVKTALKANTSGSPYVECTFSQVESVLTGTVTKDTNAAARAGDVFTQNARDIVSGLAVQGPVITVKPLEHTVHNVLIYDEGRANQQINLSQLVIRDETGANITKKGNLMTSGTAYNTRQETLVDGYMGPRAYPYIYHSPAGYGQYVWVSFSTPVTLSSITIYNRSDCCNDRITQYKLYIDWSLNHRRDQTLRGDLVQTYNFMPLAIQANMVTEDIFTPESVTRTCTELTSFRSWVDSIKNLYPDKYEKSKHHLETSDTWSTDKKNTFCNILEQTKITKTMTDSKLKTVSVL